MRKQRQNNVWFSVGWVVPLLFLTLTVQGQKIALRYSPRAVVQGSQDQLTLKEMLESVAQKHGIKITYQSNLVEKKLVSAQQVRQVLGVNKGQLEQTLLQLVRPMGLQFRQYKEDFFILQKQSVLPKVEGSSLKFSPPSLASFRVEASPLSRFKSLAAYEKTITGRVTDLSTDEGLPGVNVVVKNTTVGTVTDIEGNYRLTAPDDAETLVFSSVGYTREEVTIGNQTNINVEMAPDIQALSEVVVIGYGSVERKDLTGAVSTANIQGIAEIPVPSIDQIFSGRVAGLQITQSSGQPGSGSSIRIRGGNSLTGSNEPLFVIDGFPILNDNSALETRDATGQPNSEVGTGQGQPNGTLNWLNPADIESIEVLKDASATAIYGSRGANGVIIITTKQATDGKFRVNLNATAGFSEQLRNGVEFLTGPEYAVVRTLAQEQAEAELTFDGVDRPLAENVTQNSNWLDAITQTGITQDYSLNFSGGDKVKVSGSGSYFTQEGTLIKSQFERGTFRINVMTDLTDWLKVSNTTNYSVTVLDNPPSDTRDAVRTGPWEAALIAAPSEPIFNDDGSYFFNAADFAAPVRFNPLALAFDVLNQTTTNTYLNNLSLNFKLIEGLTFETRFGYFYNNNLRDIYYNSQTTGVGIALGGLGARNNRKYASYLWENFATYNKDWGKNSLNLVVGQSYQLSRTDDTNTTAFGFPNDVLGVNALQLGNQRLLQTGRIEDKLSSYFIRINNVFAERVIATFTARADGSSKFGSNERWALFPSGALSYRFTEDLPDDGALSDLKLRVSYGLTGNQSIRSLQSRTLLSISPTINGTDQGVAVNISQFGNDNLKWETTSQFNVGLDFGLFNQRLSGSLNYYSKRTKDLLFARNIPSSSGVSTVFDNLGEISNRGFEIELHGELVEPSDALEWSVDVNLARNISRLEDLGFEDADELFFNLAEASVVSAQGRIELREGEELGLVNGYVYDGIYQSDGDGPTFAGVPGVAGQVRYKDTDDNGDIDGSDRVIIANPNPDFIYGLTNNLRYKNFDLSLQVQGVVGGDIVNLGRVLLENNDYQGNRLRETLDYWTPQNTDARYPAPGITTGALNTLSSRQVSDGSFFRLKTLTLGYNISVEKAIVSSVRLYASVVNLLTITGYDGFSPEVSALGQDALRRNIDYYTLPQNRTISLGLSVGF